LDRRSATGRAAGRADPLDPEENLRFESAALVLVMVLGLLGAPSGARSQPSADLPLLTQQYPSPPLYQLLPHDYPYPLIRTCWTEWGICLIPFTIEPGAPCYCQAPNGARVSGVCTK
jgi:hypothetical protein